MGKTYEASQNIDASKIHAAYISKYFYASYIFFRVLSRVKSIYADHSKKSANSGFSVTK